MLRSELNQQDTADYLAACREYLTALLRSLEAEEFELLQHEPRGVDVVTQVIDWLATVPEQIHIAAKPNVG